MGLIMLMNFLLFLIIKDMLELSLERMEETPKSSSILALRAVPCVVWSIVFTSYFMIINIIKEHCICLIRVGVKQHTIFQKLWWALPHLLVINLFVICHTSLLQVLYPNHPPTRKRSPSDLGPSSHRERCFCPLTLMLGLIYIDLRIWRSMCFVVFD